MSYTRTRTRTRPRPRPRPRTHAHALNSAAAYCFLSPAAGRKAPCCARHARTPRETRGLRTTRRAGRAGRSAKPRVYSHARLSQVPAPTRSCVGFGEAIFKLISYAYVSFAGSASCAPAPSPPTPSPSGLRTSSTGKSEAPWLTCRRDKKQPKSTSTYEKSMQRARVGAGSIKVHYYQKSRNVHVARARADGQGRHLTRWAQLSLYSHKRVLERPELRYAICKRQDPALGDPTTISPKLVAEDEFTSRTPQTQSHHCLVIALGSCHQECHTILHGKKYIQGERLNELDFISLVSSIWRRIYRLRQKREFVCLCSCQTIFHLHFISDRIITFRNISTWFEQCTRTSPTYPGTNIEISRLCKILI
jgi:hypothetical protein